MKNNRRQMLIRKGTMVVMVLVSLLLVSYRPAIAAKDMRGAQGIVDNARVTLSDFLRDPNYSWLHNHLDQAKGVLIFPQVLKGGFIWGGSGGTGVFMARDEKTGAWSEPAFYTIGSVTFGLQIGGEALQVVMLAMSQKAVDSVLSTSFKLGGDVSIALGPVGAGANAQADLPSITGDFISFMKAKGLYGGLNLEGSVIAVRDSLNKVYYGRAVRPAEIVVTQSVRNSRSAEIRQSLKCKC